MCACEYFTYSVSNIGTRSKFEYGLFKTSHKYPRNTIYKNSSQSLHLKYNPQNMHNPLKKLSRSISHKILRKRESQEVSAPSTTASSPTQTSVDEDPYREILRSYEDNTSHLVYHGSSLRSMTSMDLIRNKSEEVQPSRITSSPSNRTVTFS
ncbi:unnamed protein product [Caenorhabditis angaria]|uniref:Uncharacterized protein n=1 Tax=Caenorhabditis angaria TaxID=860376 RepID=A0A9P1MWE0_9PELO|nr:unnamed protein product [Caenorhabditis angaria]